MGVRMVLQSQAPKRILWLGGSGPHKINPPSIHFIGGSESVKKKIPHTGDIESLDQCVGPIQFWRGCMIYLEKKEKKKKVYYACGSLFLPRVTA